MDILIYLITGIIVVDMVIFEIIEIRDRKKYGDVSHKDYTLFGMIKLMRKEKRGKKTVQK